MVGKSKPVSVAMTPEILDMLNKLEMEYVQIGKPQSRSAIIATLIKMAYPKLKAQLDAELARQSIKYDKPMDRLLKSIWMRELEEYK